MRSRESAFSKEIANKLVDKFLGADFGKNQRALINIVAVGLLALLGGLGYFFNSSSSDNEQGADPAVEATESVESDASDDDESGFSQSFDDSSGGTAKGLPNAPHFDGRVVPDAEEVTIERCVDGDTLIVHCEIDGKLYRERVRLIGANTPETVKPNHPIEPFGPEASEYTKRRVKETNYVATLVRDGSAFDRYNRRLAFVYLGDEEISLNEELARRGLAKVETKYSYSKRMKKRLLLAAQQAQEEGLGIYSLATDEQ